ncbi:MAG: hypothetical protein QG610_2230 [Euryarchaeota archaeon]|nr:hypothetical protein [Euryarchaeota archaeon]MDQ1276652.1 hypothetical protein [Euryarchaeota archaeon]
MSVILWIEKGEEGFKCVVWREERKALNYIYLKKYLKKT